MEIASRHNGIARTLRLVLGLIEVPFVNGLRYLQHLGVQIHILPPKRKKLTNS
jgi:hypothetical protein